MANDGTGTGWDENSPDGNDPASDGDNEIRDLRKGVRIRLNKEHATTGVSSAGGEHKAGSAKAFYAATASEPTVRPDGSTALGADDAGRLWIANDTSSLYFWDGSDWKQLIALLIDDDIVTTTKISDDAVTTAKINDGAVTTDKLDADAVTGAKIADGAVDSEHIANGAIDTAHIGDGQVTAAKLGSGIQTFIATGTYTGDGGTSNAISGLGFAPKKVEIIRSGTNTTGIYGTAIRTGTVGSSADFFAPEYGGGSGRYTNAIQFDADGFTIKSSAPRLNANAESYTYCAWG